MQDTAIAYRVAFETANLELSLIQAAMSKLQREKQRIENAFATKPEMTACRSVAFHFRAMALRTMYE
jgi:hypothetical protein